MDERNIGIIGGLILGIGFGSTIGVIFTLGVLS